MDKRERVWTRTAVVAAAALVATGCGRVLNHDDVEPASVEQKAHTLTQQTLEALRPVIGSAGTTVDRSTWQKCPTETPGQHRFVFTYSLNLAVPENLSAAVMKAARDHFTKMGYLLDPSDGRNTRAGATVPKSTWTVRLGVKDSSTTVLAAGSDCVFTTHDPPTGGSAS